MARLKNYEVEAICSTICNEFDKIKNKKIEEYKKIVQLDAESKTFLNLIVELKALEERVKDLRIQGMDLRKAIFEETACYYNWYNTTVDEIINFKAKKMLDSKFNKFNYNDVRNKIILASLDNNVNDIIDNILAEYND